MKTIGSLVFKEQANRNNRFAQIVVDPTIDQSWTIRLNGTDANGQPVFPHFVYIDNFNNPNAVTFGLDGFSSSGVAPYTIAVIAVNPLSQLLTLTVTSGQVNVWISEKELPISPGSKYTQSATAKFQFILPGTASIAVPSDWNNANNRIHCIGAGATGTNGSAGPLGGNGGGGGAYASITNFALVPNATVNCQIGAGNSGTDTWFNTSGTVLAKAAAANSRNGGTAGASIGSIKFDGGTGADNSASATNGSGGGGAGGPHGSGGNSTDASNQTGGTGDGGNVSGGLPNAGSGLAGGFWTSTVTGLAAGPGSGGAGRAGVGGGGGAAGNYGAGGGGGFNSAGGAGAGGLIVLEWTT